MKEIILANLALFLLITIAFPVCLVLACLVLWALFSFVIWDMEMFESFFVPGKTWVKAFVIWRFWTTAWVLFGLFGTALDIRKTDGDSAE